LDGYTEFSPEIKQSLDEKAKDQKLNIASFELAIQSCYILCGAGRGSSGGVSGRDGGLVA
jgi:hypothetical protein